MTFLMWIRGSTVRMRIRIFSRKYDLVGVLKVSDEIRRIWIQIRWIHTKMSWIRKKVYRKGQDCKRLFSGSMTFLVWIRGSTVRMRIRIFSQKYDLVGVLKVSDENIRIRIQIRWIHTKMSWIRKKVFYNLDPSSFLIFPVGVFTVTSVPDPDLRVFWARGMDLDPALDPDPDFLWKYDLVPDSEHGL